MNYCKGCSNSKKAAAVVNEEVSNGTLSSFAESTAASMGFLPFAILNNKQKMTAYILYLIILSWMLIYSDYVLIRCDADMIIRN